MQYFCSYPRFSNKTKTCAYTLNSKYFPSICNDSSLQLIVILPSRIFFAVSFLALSFFQVNRAQNTTGLIYDLDHQLAKYKKASRDRIVKIRLIAKNARVKLIEAAKRVKKVKSMAVELQAIILGAARAHAMHMASRTAQ